jgi:hypothetical protein
MSILYHYRRGPCNGYSGMPSLSAAFRVAIQDLSSGKRQPLRIIAEDGKEYILSFLSRNEVIRERESMEKRALLRNSPIIFHHMHAGSVNSFIWALNDALECPEPPDGAVITIYGMAQDQQGATYDLTSGREIQAIGTMGAVPPYWQMVCLIEHDLNTLTLVCPAGEIPYWDEVMFTHKASEEHFHG